MKKAILIPLGLLAAAIGLSQSLTKPREEPRRVEVLFLGAPTANGPGHDPIERYRVIRKELGAEGINFTYTEDLKDLNRNVLDRFDAVLMYANWNQHGPMDSEQEKALISYVDDGGAFLPIHCASACFGQSDAFIKLVGGRFKSHGDGVFKTKIVEPNHPLMRGYESFEAWDETYEHDRHGDDRTILQVREKEPWTWVRKQGKGNVFYTAYGHDMRCWGHEGFHELMRRAILWSVGAEVRSKVMGLKLPELETEEVLLPGYRERKAITRAQKPLSPADSMKLAQVPAGFEISLFASEPDIVNPIYIAWDHRGRAFVIETVDYPNNLQAGNMGHDRIKICEDTNGDGKADKFTVFADKLSVPTALVFANGGVICTNGTEMLFLKDTNGDDKADVRQVLFNGFKMHDTHAGPSSLRYGFDQWIYATIGYSGFEGTVGGETHKFSTGLFRFKADGSKLEFLQNTTNNTWGLGFTSDFDILGSTANGNPSWYYTLPKALHDEAGVSQPRTPTKDGNPMFFPISTDIRQVDQMDRYTSAAGHTFYTSRRFPEGNENRIAYVCEPTGKLVGQFEVTQDGAGYLARQLPNNLYSSADAWSGPVHAETGPDGAVWICDWYNLIIQHNPTPNKGSAGYDAKNGRGNAYESPLRDKRHGRIYRVYPKGSPNDVNPKLSVSTPATLIAALDHSNLFWRQQAQRLLVEGKVTAAVPKLKEIVRKGGYAGLHAFHALQGLNALDSETVVAAYETSHRGLRRAAIQHEPIDLGLVAKWTAEGALAQVSDARELAETFAALARVESSEQIGATLNAVLIARQEVIMKDAVLKDAWQIAARKHAAGVILASTSTTKSDGEQEAAVNVLANGDFSSGELGGWSLRRYVEENPGGSELSISKDGGRNGSPALMIRSNERADVGAGMDVAVSPNTRYRLSAWVRTENLQNRGGRGAMLNVHATDASTEAIHGTKDWTELSVEFDSGSRNSILIHCLFGGYGGSIGTAYWDDVSLVQIAGGNASGEVRQVVSHFASRGDAAARKALTEKLSAIPGEYAAGLIRSLGETPVEVKPMVRTHKPDPEVHKRGLDVYSKTCVACHGPDGKGVPGAFPPLDGAEWAVGDTSVPIRIVLQGLMGPIEVAGQKFESVMPPHTDLSDQEIADVLTYVRQNWANDAAPVAADVVKETRAKFSGRATPWTAAELK